MMQFVSSVNVRGISNYPKSSNVIVIKVSKTSSRSFVTAANIRKHFLAMIAPLDRLPLLVNAPE
jgi:hypothetical protein